MPLKVLNLYKKIGETPLERLDRYRIENPDYKTEVLSYAGRLDPLADGVMIALVGDQNKDQKQFFGLDKTYEVEVLFGFYTDTYDILGLVREDTQNYDLSKLSEFAKTLVGTHEQKYPPYSSKNVSGKPLFHWARSGKLDEIEIPTREIRIDRIEILEQRKILKNDLENVVSERIDLVKGDFRQQEIKNTWKEVLSNSEKEDFDIVKLRVSCGEGAYMRTLCENLGAMLGSRALAFSIRRTRVGEYKIEDSKQ